MSHDVLLVEDDDGIAMVIVEALREGRYAVTRCSSIAERDSLLTARRFDVMLTDVVLTDGDGLATLDRAQQLAPDMPVIVLSAQNTLDTAVRASDSGVFEYFPKPFDLDELVATVGRAVADRPGVSILGDNDDNLPLIGRSVAMQRVYRMITRVLRNDLTVLVTGDSGTGKELVAEAIHQLGARKTGPFVAVNAAAIPRDLIESELFGHERGAFTGAVSQAIGKFEQANGGTLFLDEIGDMPVEAQTRLLRALQSGRIRRVGGRQEIGVDVRIIAATNRDLMPMIADGRFREDLYYRLAVVPIELPPLRDRRDDIGALARHFLVQAAAEGLPRRQLGDDAIEQLSRLDWPGNVRELRNTVFRLALMARDSVIDDACVNEVVADTKRADAAEPGCGFAEALDEWLKSERPAIGQLYHGALAAFERPLFEYALEQNGGNQLRAAKLLGINRNTLRKRLGELGIDADSFARRR